MDDKKWEELNDERWTFEFTNLPNVDANPESLQTTDKLETADDETSLQMKFILDRWDVDSTDSSFQSSLIPDVSLNIEFTDHEDEQSVYNWLCHWCDLVYEANHGRLDTLSDENLFEFTDASTGINCHLKKPIDELNDEERERVIDVLRECFNASDEILRKVNLIK
jgi:hypothetical protein